MSEASEQRGSVTQQLHNLQNEDQNADAQRELFRRYYHTVVDKARRRVQRLAVADASDVAVSVWDTVLRGLPEGKFPCKDREEFEELLGKITFHKAINIYKWFKRWKRHPHERLDEKDILESKPLDERYRQVAELRYLDGKTPQEIAEHLRLSTDVVSEHLDHIKAWLQKHRYRLTSHAPSDAVNEVPADRPPDVLLFEEQLLAMDKTLQETVILKLQGLHNRQIAERMDVTERQIQRRLKLVRDQLRAELTEDSVDG